MKAALLLALALAASVVLVAAPTASACPDPDNPCDPQPIDPLPACRPGQSAYGCVKEWLMQLPP